MKAVITALTSRWRSISLAALLLLLSLYVLDYAYPLQLPSESSAYSQIVTARDGRILRAFADDKGIWRQYTNQETVSPLYLEALLHYEDRWFWQHPGVNPFALMRAAWLNFQCGCIVSGGSTLTMQVARRFHPHSRTVWGKLQQMLRALQLEWHLEKSEILSLYLNFAPFGGTIEGVEAASQAYLHKSAARLTHAEAALLAVLPQAPSRMRPDRHPQRAQAARDKVLGRMVDLGVWDKTLVQQAVLEQVFAEKPERPMLAPLLARRLSQQHPAQHVIATHIDYDIQQALEDKLYYWIKGQPKYSSAAVLVIDNQSHQVVAYLGSADFQDKSRFAHVDMVQAIRSPGSTLKPFIYVMAMDKGLIHSHSLLSDAPRLFSEYKPQNFHRHFSGPVSVTSALQRSLNVPAVQVLQALGAASFYHQLQSAGIHLQLPANAKPNLSLALGGAGISLWDIAHLYAALVNNGQLQIAQTHNEKAGAPRYLMSPEAAWVMHRILMGHDRPGAVINENIQRKTQQMAWKTGTSYGYRDAWAIGVSARYTLGVWTGRPDGTPTPGHYGALSAAPLLFDIADTLHQLGYPTLERPEGVAQQAICWPLGSLKARTQTEHCHKYMDAWIIRQQVPPTLKEASDDPWASNPLTLWINPATHRLVNLKCDVAERKSIQIALWPRILEPWVAAKYKRQRQIPAVDKACSDVISLDAGRLKITGITDGSIYRSSADALPDIALQALGGRGQKDWFVNGRFVFSTDHHSGSTYTFSRYGAQQIMVVDEQGDIDKIDVFVEKN